MLKGLITKIDRIDMIKSAFDEQAIDLIIVQNSCPPVDRDSESIYFEPDKFKYLKLVQQTIDNENIDFVFSTSGYDDLVILDSNIKDYCDEKGIPFIGQSNENAVICYDKFVTKAILKYSNIPVVDCMLCRDDKQLGEAINKLGTTIICKKPNGWSGIGQMVLDVSKNDKDKTPKISYPLIAEKFLHAREISVSIYSQNGEHYCFPPVYKGYTSQTDNHALNKLRVCPYPWGSDFEQNLYSIAISAAKAVKSTGWSEIEMFWFEDNTIQISEINARLCGVTRMIAMSTNLNPYTFSIDRLMGKSSEEVIDAKCVVVEFPFYEKIPEIKSTDIFVHYSKTPERYLGKITAKLEDDIIPETLYELMYQGNCEKFLSQIESLIELSSKNKEFNTLR